MMLRESKALVGMAMYVSLPGISSYLDFSWIRKYSKEFDDIFITRIADVEQGDNEFWGILLNYQSVFILANSP
jgi:hypothetical protein